MPLLMDTIAGAAATVAASAARTGRQPHPLLLVYGRLVERLRGVPRFLLDAKATTTMVELNLGRPKVTLEAMQHLRVPYRAMWVEWDDADRQKLRDRFEEEITLKELRPLPGRVGFLLEADDGGRSGKVTWAWTTPTAEGGDQFPNIGAIECRFELDRRFDLPDARVEGLLKGNLAAQWLNNPVQLEALFDIWRTCEHGPSDWGQHYLAALTERDGSDLYERLAYSDVVGEYIVVWAVTLMLTASRTIVDYRTVDRTKINKRRTRPGEAPLFDHTEVTLHMTSREIAGRPAAPLGHQRKSPRVHMVSSYLARRGDKHWIVSPYFRGQGETIHRRVNVRG